MSRPAGQAPVMLAALLYFAGWFAIGMYLFAVLYGLDLAVRIAARLA